MGSKVRRRPQRHRSAMDAKVNDAKVRLGLPLARKQNWRVLMVEGEDGDLVLPVDRREVHLFDSMMVMESICGRARASHSSYMADRTGLAFCMTCLSMAEFV